MINNEVKKENCIESICKLNYIVAQIYSVLVNF
jgi:hypothetical protein